jgi:hypothetical protein
MFAAKLKEASSTVHLSSDSCYVVGRGSADITLENVPKTGVSLRTVSMIATAAPL